MIELMTFSVPVSSDLLLSSPAARTRTTPLRWRRGRETTRALLLLLLLEIGAAAARAEVERARGGDMAVLSDERESEREIGEREQR